MDRLQVKIEIDRLNQEIKELKSENARCREALEHIFFQKHKHHVCCEFEKERNNLITHFMDITREALKGE